jgi:hypothetical protein
VAFQLVLGGGILLAVWTRILGVPMSPWPARLGLDWCSRGFARAPLRCLASSRLVSAIPTNVTVVGCCLRSSAGVCRGMWYCRLCADVARRVQPRVASEPVVCVGGQMGILGGARNVVRSRGGCRAHPLCGNGWDSPESPPLTATLGWRMGSVDRGPWCHKSEGRLHRESSHTARCLCNGVN